MAMSERVHIARRFLRSIRIDTDLKDVKTLEGFICPQSSTDALLTMVRHAQETGQGAFTWTGPYGSGKSSLVIALSGLLNEDVHFQKQAAKALGRQLTSRIRKALSIGAKGWHVLPVIGRRDHPVRVIGEAMKSAGLVSRQPPGGWTEVKLIRAITKVTASVSQSRGGLIVFIDEMGKFLEAAAQDGTDIYIFQQLAEVASRSGGRLLIVGILHQAFEGYAYQLSREMRDEWAKIQGRFIDLPINTAGEEQISLISRAIESKHQAKTPGSLAREVASLIHRDRSTDSERLALMLENCWPLHPIVTCLLGPISRRRFGQNQRSIFGFLNSAEPHGFQYFLRHADDRALYRPDQLWDYLRTNLEPSILASPNGHRWALAAEALERCESVGGDAVHIQLLKTIAVVDLFKEHSGILPSFALLHTCFPEIAENKFKKILKQLDNWSLTLFKKFLDAYAIFAGSDFDIEEAVSTKLAEVDTVDFAVLRTLADLQPVLAKRHYHETGTLRWFEVNLAPLCDIVNLTTNYSPDNGTVGQFLLAIPTEGENEETAENLCRNAARDSDMRDVVVGISKRSGLIVTLARELIALEKVRNEKPELAGDAVARREVTARLATLQGKLESELYKAFDGARWFRKSDPPKIYGHAGLNILASELADRRFNKCPKLHNELLNRHKPSGSAIAAQNALLRRMVLNEGELRLGIEGYPAEGGLFASILEKTNLYAESKDGRRFTTPLGEDPYRLKPIWEAAIEYIKSNSNRTISVSDIYDIWRDQPFGVKNGLMTVLAVAFILSQRSSLAVYREGIFRARFDDIDVEYLAKDPATIQLRWMDLSDVSRRMLSDMAEIVRTLDRDNELVHLESLDVARGLVRIYEQLPQWTKRTMRLSENAIRVRDLFKRASDPNQFLFDDIPATIGTAVGCTADKDFQHIVVRLREGLEELVQAYSAMLHRLRDIMLTELQVPNLAPQSLVELRDRATNARQLAGDFRVEAFVGRLSQFDGTDEAFEGIASLAANKPPHTWVDPDLDRAMVSIADMAQKFLRTETFTRVKGRPEKRHAMAVVIGTNGRPVPILEEFDVADSDRDAIDEVIERMLVALAGADKGHRSIILAALAELSARYMTEQPKIEYRKRSVSDGN